MVLEHGHFCLEAGPSVIVFSFTMKRLAPKFDGTIVLITPLAGTAVGKAEGVLRQKFFLISAFEVMAISITTMTAMTGTKGRHP